MVASYSPKQRFTRFPIFIAVKVVRIAVLVVIEAIGTLAEATLMADLIDERLTNWLPDDARIYDST